MKIISSKVELFEFLQSLKDEDRKIGFIPTMGAIHFGHLGLVKRASRENNITVCSIFVNPTQFGNKDELKKYPRNLDRDAELLSKANCDILFTPLQEDLYDSENIEAELNSIELNKIDETLEGAIKPKHFKGVAFILEKFFRIIEPDSAYFGNKDFQQLQIIRYYVKENNIPVKIIGCDTVREQNGLAISSRNEKLSLEEKNTAAIIYSSLVECKSISKNLSVSDTKSFAINRINQLSELNCEYFEIVDSESFKPLKNWTDSNTIIGCIAVQFKGIRLIDNITL
ncbi:MAG: pantoate--beta-alanine ligase [Flavobacteriales bacterium]|nr:pantoate--beta-alanine ligase [Flavobacteriales bacterium]